MQAGVEDIVGQQDVEAQLEAERRQERVRAGSSRGGIRHYKGCGEIGHNKRTCKKDRVDFED